MSSLIPTLCYALSSYHPDSSPLTPKYRYCKGELYLPQAYLSSPAPIPAKIASQGAAPDSIMSGMNHPDEYSIRLEHFSNHGFTLLVAWGRNRTWLFDTFANFYEQLSTFPIIASNLINHLRSQEFTTDAFDEAHPYYFTPEVEYLHFWNSSANS